jgi:aminomethyltransferase
MLKHTPLFAAHQALGAKLIDFGGWEMPVQYTSITDEHLTVRNAAGIFDISHMGEVTVSGAAARPFLNSVLTNDIRKLESGTGQYTLLCNERGGVIDDLYVFQLSIEVYFLIVNASRTQADVEWLWTRAAAFAGGDDLRLTDASHQYAAVAVQGPRVAEFMDSCIPGSACSGKRVRRITDLHKNEIAGFPFGTANIMASRTGYTGEDGFEIVGRDGSIRQVWDVILNAGRPFGIKPCGLGARDTLRTEACYSLYGHELDENTTPIEAGLGSFVVLEKAGFTGRAVLAEQKEKGPARKCVAFKMAEKSPPPRPHYPMLIEGAKVGEVTSGTQSPSLGIGIGMGYVPSASARPGTTIGIEIRGKVFPATVVAKPIYRSARDAMPKAK